MAETEVETILREIRERVLAAQLAGRDVAANPLSNGGNGAGEAGSSNQLVRPDGGEGLAAGNPSLINSYLTTTARAWDRLPPMVSNRSGVIARVELWLKRRLKAGTRWFTWEQVNFNAAVHHALRDLLPIFVANEAELRMLRTRIAAAEAATQAETAARQTDFAEYRVGLATQLNDLQAHVEAQLGTLVNELRERDAHLRDEQRVCYKQLALETSEAAVLEDRARRQTEALLAELTQRVGQLEK
jgi:multidrug resistance efflux pump